MPTRFKDEYAPDEMPGFPCISVPMFNTVITQVDSGDEQINRRWQQPLYKFTLPDAVRSHEIFEAVNAHWLVMGGPAHTWPFKDPLDFASVSLAYPNEPNPTISNTDQTIGTGDGTTLTFQLVKRYTRGAETWDRDIHLPISTSVTISIQATGSTASTAVSSTAYTISRPGGVVTFTVAPSNNSAVRAGYYFDNEVRFESDDTMEGIVKTYGISGFADITLIGVRNC